MSSPSLMSIPTFVAQYSISRSTLYKLWKEGRGPKITRVHGRTLIGARAADEWAAQMEAETEQPGTRH
jgi:predicted DNA-binding transcriptional regulator AlpA